MARPDLTVLAIPAFVGAMGAEYWWMHHKRPAAPDEDRPGDYEPVSYTHLRAHET